MTAIPSGTKFIGISPNVPTPENRSALSNNYQEVYTIDDIISATGTDDFYNLDGTMSSNRTVDLDGNFVTFTNGNFGIGVTPTAKLHIRKEAQTGGENLAKFEVSDDSVSFLEIANQTGTNNLFLPMIRGIQGADYNALSLIGQGTTDIGSAALIVLDSRISSSAATVRPLCQWSNYGSPVMMLSASGNLGIGTTTPTEKLEVSGKTKTTTFQMTTAPTAGYVLTSDASGNGTWAAAGSSSGKFGIPDSTGAYTFYSTLGAAITAASAGQTVEFFTDYIETGSVEITLKDGVNINGNGHTYTLNNSGTIQAFKTANSVSIECSIFNLNVVRTGGTAQQSQNASLYVGTSTSGNIYLRGSRFINNGSGSGIAIGGSSTISIYDGYANANTAFGSIYFESSAGAKAINCVGISNTQVGISCYIGGDLYRCYGQSNSNVGIDGSGATGTGSQYDCTGVSTSSAGMTTGAKAVNCTGISVSGNGINSGARVYNSTGISTSGRGISNGSGILYNCTAISSSNVGVLLQSTGGTMHNCVTQSESSYTIWGWAGSAVYNSTIICNWNNAGGNGIQGIGGSITPTIINCTFKLSNASAPYLENGGTAQAISMRGNTYQGGAAFNANLTQAITATEDNQGNIFL